MLKFSHIILIISVLCHFNGMGQVIISAPNFSGKSITNYQGVSQQDAIYVFCPPSIDQNEAQLNASVENPTELYVFVWSKFNSTTNTYESYQIDNNLTSSTITNLQDGCYSVDVYSQLGTIIGCSRAWVFSNDPLLTISKLPEICSPFQLNVNIEHKSELTYYNPPVDYLTINEETEITVCFSANHAYVSDLGFYLVGPEQCGSPQIKLMESFAISENNTVCNGGDHVNQLCFSTNSSQFITNPCKAPTPLTGTYASAESWSAIYGCQANQPGWKVQIYDCIAGDIGTLTHAQIIFSSNTNDCRPIEINYDSGAINSTIKDNSCTTEKASSFVVEPTNATPIVLTNEVQYVWDEDAPFFELNNNGIGKSIYVPKPPKTYTHFEVSSTDDFGCMSTTGVDYAFVPLTYPTINHPPILCQNYSIQQFTGVPENGVWAGQGIVDETQGLFDPGLIVGKTKIFYTDQTMCGGVAIDSFIVQETPTAEILGKSPICDYNNNGSISLVTSDTGYWDFGWYNQQWELLSQQDMNDVTLDNINIGQYFAKIHFSNQCIDTVDIDFKSKQTADVSITPSAIETSIAVPIVTFYGEAKTPLTSSQFSIDNQVFATNTDTYIHEFDKFPGTYQASFVGKDALGCYDTASVDIQLIHEFAFYIPSSFTPNGDGVNDVLRIHATDLNLEEYEIEIINRWSDLVFYSRNINETWNGTYDGTLVPSGRYLYHVSGKSKTTGQTSEYTDFILIIY